MIKIAARSPNRFQRFIVVNDLKPLKRFNLNMTFAIHRAKATV